MNSSELGAFLSRISYRSGKLTGHQDVTNARSGKLTGHTDTSDARSGKLTGVILADDARSGKLTGHQDISDARSGKLTGHIDSSSARSGKIHGLSIDARSGKLTGHVDTSDARSGKLTGHTDSSDARSGKLTGHIDSSDARSGKLTGYIDTSDARSGKLTGHLDISDARSGKLTGHIDISDARSGKLTGHIDASDARSGKLTGSAGATDVENARSGKLTGHIDTSDARSGKVTGHIDTSDARSGKLTGYIDASDARSGKLTGHIDSSSARSGKITGTPNAVPGDFFIARNNAETDTLTTSNLDATWDTNVDSSGTSIAHTASSADFTLAAGKYLVLYGESFSTTDTTAGERIEVQGRLTLDGTQQDAGASWGYIPKIGNALETAPFAGTIIDVPSINTVLNTRFFRTDDSTVGDPTRQPDWSGVQIYTLDHNWNYARYEVTSNRDGPNSNDSWADFSWDNNIEQDTGFSRSGADITLTDAGKYLVCLSIPIQGEGSVLQESRIRLMYNDVEVEGTRAYTYIKNIDGCTDGCISYVGMVRATGTSQVLKVQIQGTAGHGAGTEGTILDGGTIQLLQLPETARTIFLEATTGDFNPNGWTAFDWDSEAQVNGGTFNWDSTPDADNIDVLRAGDYLFFGCQSATDNAGGRLLPSIQIAVGDTRKSYVTHTAYNRGASSADNPAVNLGALLPGLTNTDIVQIYNNRLGNINAITCDNGALQGLNLNSLFLDTDSRSGKLTGYIDTSDARSGKVTGHTDSSDARSGKLTGHVDSSDARSGKLTGHVDASDARSGKITGTDTGTLATDARSGKLTGHIDTSDARSGKLTGYIDTSDARSGKLTGHVDASDSRSGKLTGHVDASNARSGKLTGYIDVSDARSGKLTGHVDASDARSGKLTGHIDSSDARSGKIHGLSVDARSGKLTGHIDSSDARSGKLTGHTDSSDARSGKLTGHVDSSDARSGKLTGHVDASDARSGKITGYIDASDARSGKITGTDTGTLATDARSGKLTGHVDASDARSSKLTGHVDSSDARSGKLTGHVDAPDARSGKLTGHTDVTNARSGKLTGHVDASDARSGKLTGHVDASDARSGKLTGHVDASDARSGKITGGIISVNSRSGKLHGYADIGNARSGKITGYIDSSSARSGKVTGPAYSRRSGKITGTGGDVSSSRSGKIEGARGVACTTSGIVANRDGYIHGLSTLSYADAGDASNRTPYNALASNIAGGSYDWIQEFNPIASWARYRAFLSFNTQGQLNGALGHVESVTLKMYMNDVRSHDVGNGSWKGDYDIRIYTVSGAARNQPTSSTYGWGDSVTVVPAGDEVDDWLEITEPWEVAKHYKYSDHAAGAASTVTEGDGNVVRYYDGYLSVEIPSKYINNAGESHFIIAFPDEINEVDPRNDEITNQDVHTYANYSSIEDADVLRRPTLEVKHCIFYGAPYMGDLRIHDLSVNRAIQAHLDQNLTFSGTYIMDGYPEDEREFRENRNIALEHVNTVEDSAEITKGLNSMDRLFAIDVVCKRKGELDDLTSLISTRLRNSLPIWDFNYGFTNPPEIGRLRIEDIDIVGLQPILGAKYHNLITFSAVVLRSGV
ncbi:MAG: hypothetical protein ACXAEN_20205 [Candidatus Thorarchaeota archaeon]